MTTPMSKAFIKMGDTGQETYFGPTNTLLGSQQIDLQLDLIDPEPFPSGAVIRFILTASDRYQPSGTGGIHSAFPAAAVLLEPASPNTYTILARNTDTAQGGGSASFFWLAIAENVGPRQTLPIPINQTFVGQPASFSATNSFGDHQQLPNFFDPTSPGNRPYRYAFNGTFGPGPFGLTVAERPLVFATANNIGCGPAHNAAAIGLVQDAFYGAPFFPSIDPTGFQMKARNSDTAAGFCGFNWVALQQGLSNSPLAPSYSLGVPQPADLLVDTGQSLEFSFAPTNHYGDWVSAEIQFSVPFLIEPVVLLTARVPNFGGFGNPGTGTVESGCAPVAIAQNVTRFGFTLAARNSDTNGNGGVAYFDWVAFGL
jgi:hypothetical protein